MNERTLKRSNVVAEITITKSDARFAWSVVLAGNIHASGTSYPTPSEAVWRAVDEVRRDDQHSGIVAVYAHDNHNIAFAPLWAVPSYDNLEWEPLAEQVRLTSMSDIDSWTEPTFVGVP